MFKWYSEIPCLTVITLIRMICVYSYSKKGPIKTKYLFDKVFWLVVSVFLEYDYKLLLKICMTINPGKNFIIILQNYPIRTMFILDTMFWLVIQWEQCLYLIQCSDWMVLNFQVQNSYSEVLRPQGHIITITCKYFLI